VKVNPRTQCHKYQRYGHFTNQCSSQTTTFLVEVSIEDGEDELEVVMHQQDDDLDAFAENREFNGYIITLALTDLTPNYDRAHLEVVRWTLTQSEQVNDWRTATFHMFTKIADKNCKVIADSENCINGVLSKVTEKFGLKVVSYPHPYKVSWINSTALKVKQRCLVPVNFNLHKDKIWCDVTMNVGQIIQGRA